MKGLALQHFFAPEDNIQQQILNGAKEAGLCIYMSMYGFHLPPLTDIFIAQYKAGRSLRLLLDHSQEEGKAEKAEVQKLVDAGISVLIGTSPDSHQILHSKYLLTDHTKVMTGSYNFSLSAAQQDNTFMIITEPLIVQDYESHFTAAWAWVQANEQQYQLEQTSTI